VTTDGLPTSSLQQRESDPSVALGEGDPRRVVALIEAGADIRYKRPVRLAQRLSARIHPFLRQCESGTNE
jgi:hypothetical protein